MKRSRISTAGLVAAAISFAAVVPGNPVWAAGGPAAAGQEHDVDEMDHTREEILGLYSTSMAGSSDARIHNIEKAVNLLNGEKIEPHRLFSYNDTIGNSNLADDGWEKAGVIANGRLTDDFGGGICQVSSTLFNAAAGAGMLIVERHSHSKTVSYVPPGLDATVAYGQLDFQFVNPYDYPVKIKAKTYADNLVVITIVRA